MSAHDSHIPVAAIRAASQRSELVAAMRFLYDQTDRLIASHAPVCWNRGLCCRFGQYGHRLFVTSLEAAYYLSGHPEVPAFTEDACPHALEGACQARLHRPLGCRIFYCDPSASFWQGMLTEERLAHLRAWHGQFDVPYVYTDWMAMLRALGGDSHPACPGLP